MEALISIVIIFAIIMAIGIAIDLVAANFDLIIVAEFP